MAFPRGVHTAGDAASLTVGSVPCTNSTTLPYGIEFTGDHARSSSSLADHPITRGVSTVPGGGSLLRVAPPAQALARLEAGGVVLAISSHGDGRTVAISDDGICEDLSLEHRGRRRHEHRRFVENLLRWLLRLDSEGARDQVGRAGGVGERRSSTRLQPSVSRPSVAARCPPNLSGAAIWRVCDRFGIVCRQRFQA